MNRTGKNIIKFEAQTQGQTVSSVRSVFIDTGQQFRCLDSSKSIVYRSARTQSYSSKMVHPCRQISLTPEVWTRS